MNNIFTLSLADIAPLNLIHDDNISSVIHALDPQLLSVSYDSLLPLLIPRIDSLPDYVLDVLALQFHCDFYDLAMTHDMKASAVSSSLHWHMKKGTASAIIESLKALGIEAEFVPWWKFDGQPYTFRIKANITGDFYRGAGKDRITKLITRAVNESKSARSFMAALDTSLNFADNIIINAAVASLISGNIHFIPSYHDSFQQSMIYSACIFHSKHFHILRPHNDRLIESQATFGAVRYEYINQNIGVDLETMQELLLQFEKRIFQRLDAIESGLNLKIDERTNNLDAKIDSVIELLRWKGDDEEL